MKSFTLLVWFPDPEIEITEGDPVGVVARMACSKTEGIGFSSSLALAGRVKKGEPIFEIGIELAKSEQNNSRQNSLTSFIPFNFRRTRLDEKILKDFSNLDTPSQVTSKKTTVMQLLNNSYSSNARITDPNGFLCPGNDSLVPNVILSRVSKQGSFCV